MQTVELNTQKRDLTTKGGLRQVRLAGRIPTAVYGGKKDPANVSIDAKDFLKMMTAHGHNVLVNLKSEAGTDLALVQEVQRDVITRAPIHVDFRRISMTDKIEVSVPLHVKGEAPGVKLQGGILELILHDLRVKCLPADIPSELILDVSGLNINQGLKVKDIVLPKGVETEIESDRLVLNVVSPTEFKEETPAAGAPVAGAGEPEVIAKGKKPEEGAEGAAPAAKGAAPAAGAKAAAPAAGAKPAAPAKK
jgi:large subunit ribosomal protein L25